MNGSLTSRLQSSLPRTLAWAAVSFVVITALRWATPGPGEAITFLYVVPVALVALASGPRAGAAAAAFGFAWFVVWAVAHDVQVGVWGYVARAVALGLTGVLTGLLAARLSQGRTLLDAIVNGTTDAVFVKDRQGRYRLVNSALADLLGLAPDEIIGRTDTELFPTDVAVGLIANDQRVVESNEVTSVEEVAAFAGQQRLFNSTKGPIKSADGDPVGVFGIARDVTDRRRAERAIERYSAKVEETNAAVRTYISIVAHHLRGPLGTIRGFSSILDEVWDETSAEDRRRFLRSILEQSGQALRVVDDLVLLSDLEAGSVRAEPRELLLADVLREALEDFGSEDTTLSCPADVVARMDPEHLRKVLHIYLGNAMRHGRPPVDIEVHVENGWAVVEVRDAGGGVPGDVAERLFQPLGAGRASPDAHRGLGLSMVAGLARLNGAEAFYNPERSAFALRLPLTEPT